MLGECATVWKGDGVPVWLGRDGDGVVEAGAAGQALDGRTDAGAGERTPGADPQIFAALFRDQAGRVFRLLLRLGVAERDAEDLCQEVFLTAHRCWTDFRGTAKRSTWLCGIAVRVAANHRRLARVRRERLDDQPALEQASALETADVGLEQRQRNALLHRVLSELPEPRRQVLVLYELEGLGMSEVADMIGVPLQTGYSRLHAARKDLRTALERARRRGEL